LHPNSLTDRELQISRNCDDPSKNRYRPQDGPDQDRPDVGAIMTAATLRQTAAPHATVKSNIHMADDPSYCFGSGINAVHGFRFPGIFRWYDKTSTGNPLPRMGYAREFFSFAFRRAIQHPDA
jgi:hypothetical protein